MGTAISHLPHELFVIDKLKLVALFEADGQVVKNVKEAKQWAAERGVTITDTDYGYIEYKKPRYYEELNLDTEFDA